MTTLARSAIPTTETITIMPNVHNDPKLLSNEPVGFQAGAVVKADITNSASSRSGELRQSPINVMPIR